ncbi:MAG: hypothetical protein J1F11_03450 [Oscillospiraceae bacterium]|nr:hypothetical protein [Oscillospiraceae bacterium]
MVKTIIGGVDVQEYTTSYAIKSPPITGGNSFQSVTGNYISGIIGSEVTLDIKLEAVPTPVSMALAKALEGESVMVDYTTPVPARNRFYKVSYDAECEDADPGNKDFDITDGILWNISLSLRSAEAADKGGGL